MKKTIYKGRSCGFSTAMVDIDLIRDAMAHKKCIKLDRFNYYEYLRSHIWAGLKENNYYTQKCLMCGEVKKTQCGTIDGRFGCTMERVINEE